MHLNYIQEYNMLQTNYPSKHMYALSNLNIQWLSLVAFFFHLLCSHVLCTKNRVVEYEYAEMNFRFKH